MRKIYIIFCTLQRLINMDTGLVKQVNENSRSSSSVIIDVKADDAGIEMVDQTTSKEYHETENCPASQSFQGKDRLGAEEIINGTSKSTSGGESSISKDELKMCRICHLANWECSDSEILIQLGCGCKNELGAAHLTCAQTWFKLKGNRLCEICGKIALNVSEVEETNTNANNTNVILVVEWDEMGRFRSSATATRGNTIIQDRERCHRHCRNVVLACLVLAFMFPWLFRINFF